LPPCLLPSASFHSASLHLPRDLLTA
jgi:hypothetical protein